METYETRLPKIYTERLTTREQMEAEATRLTGGRNWDKYEWRENKQAVVKVCVKNGYGNSVSVWDETQFSIGAWVVWSDPDETRFILHPDGTHDKIDPNHIPASLFRPVVVGL